ncbi:MAG: hypothetical protein SOZ11_03715 [Bacilli bacterium]|nr:hypothetical protein [Bacilli bacterium]
MNDFIKKWNSDKKFKAAIKLLLYFLFFIVVAIYAVSSNKNASQIDTEKNIENNEIINNQQQQNSIINLGDNYKYTATITINDEQIKYVYSKEQDLLNIKKIRNLIETNYIIENNNYYIKENDNKILTTKDNIYDIVCPNCFDINSINEYLNKGIKENNNYKIYLKDIILAEKGDEYITITTDNNQIYADYTSLLQVFNNQIVKYTVNIKIEE